MADEFKFNLQSDNFDDLYFFAQKHKTTGVNLGNNNHINKEICQKYIKIALDYYDKACGNSNKNECYNMSLYFASPGSLDSEFFH